jgi:hypothetical protein
MYEIMQCPNWYQYEEFDKNLGEKVAILTQLPAIYAEKMTAT